MRMRIPGMYAFIIGILVAIMVTMVLWYTGWVKTESFLTDILIIVVTWVFISGLALLGAIILGMFLGHRILSFKGFTPFEKEMLLMRSDIKMISKRLDAIEEELEKIHFDLEHKEW